jgi:hypothetical protein
MSVTELRRISVWHTIKGKHMRKILAAAAALAMAPAQADIVTEFGMGYKLPSTSAVMMPICEQVLLQGRQLEDPSSPNWGKTHASCGGNNPAFVGWPIAWESSWKGPWRVRAGYFHYSNWFDGGTNFTNLGDRHETHMDLAAVTATFNWTRWRKSR